MAGGSSWQQTREQANWRLPGNDRLRWWATAGVLLSLLLHVIAFFIIGGRQIPFGLGLSQPAEIHTGPIEINNVEVSPMDTPTPAPADTVLTPPKEVAPLLDDIEIFDKLPPQPELDMRPDVKSAAYDIKIGEARASGDLKGNTPEPVKGFDIDAEVPDFGRSERLMPTVADGQVTIDPGGMKSEDFDGQKVIDDLLKKGNGGKAEHGTLQGSLEDLIGLPANVLQGKTTVLPSDLMFEYNSAQLRESARIGLAKLAVLISLNPEMYCWIEGYSDLFGGDDFNLSLSQKRADAVKEYLVKSQMLDGKRIIPMGYGKQQPRVLTGSIDEQAPNRRVEIKMRKTAPPARPVVSAAPTPPPAPVPATRPVQDPPIPKAVLVKPARALPVEEETPSRPAPPRAKPVPDAPPRARAVEEEPPRAIVPRAERVEE